MSKNIKIFIYITISISALIFLLISFVSIIQENAESVRVRPQGHRRERAAHRALLHEHDEEKIIPGQLQPRIT